MRHCLSRRRLTSVKEERRIKRILRVRRHLEELYVTAPTFWSAAVVYNRIQQIDLFHDHIYDSRVARKLKFKARYFTELEAARNGKK